MPAKRKQKITTVAIHPETRKKLETFKINLKDTPDKIINRLMNGVTDVYVEFVLIDNELPQSHTAVFQLGTDKESLYHWTGQETKPITLAGAQKLLKAPKVEVPKQ